VAAGQWRGRSGGVQGGHRRPQDGFGFGHAAGSELAAGHGPIVRAHERHAVGAQGGQVSPGGRVQPHAHVHRRGHQHRLVGGQQGGGRQIARQAVGRLGHEIGGGRRHQHQVGAPRQLDVVHLRFVAQGEQVRAHRVFGQGGQRQRRDELRARGGQDRPHRHARLAQQANQLQRLIGRHASAHDQQHPLLVHRRRPLC
jgi:hypothetical protein